MPVDDASDRLLRIIEDYERVAEAVRLMVEYVEGDHYAVSDSADL